MGEFIALSFSCLVLLGSESWEGELRDILGVVVQKFFNRSPITLKFGAEKIREREP